LSNIKNTNLQTMDHIVYIQDTEPIQLKTVIGGDLNLNNRICKIHFVEKDVWMYLKIISETSTSFSCIRLQQDQYNNQKFYITDEKNKFHGIINDGSLTKGRIIYLVDTQ